MAYVSPHVHTYTYVMVHTHTTHTTHTGTHTRIHLDSQPPVECIVFLTASIPTELNTTRQFQGFVERHKLSVFGHTIGVSWCELGKCVIQGKVSV